MIELSWRMDVIQLKRSKVVFFFFYFLFEAKTDFVIFSGHSFCCCWKMMNNWIEFVKIDVKWDRILNYFIMRYPKPYPFFLITVVFTFSEALKCFIFHSIFSTNKTENIYILNICTQIQALSAQSDIRLRSIASPFQCSIYCWHLRINTWSYFCVCMCVYVW